ncbi:MAG: hypothetical protein R6U40_12400 [Desulfobacterales bacterium]
MGTLVPGLAEQNMESARFVIHCLIWNLNDESGGIGRGVSAEIFRPSDILCSKDISEKVTKSGSLMESTGILSLSNIESTPTIPLF